jgi:iron(III) transport system substrate-binding protein
MAHQKRWISGVVATTTAALALTGCSSSAGGSGDAKANADAFTKYGALSADERDPQLAKLAAKEGTIQVYTSFQDMDQLGKAFEAKYPGLKVQIYRADSETAWAKVQQESQAGRTQADVVETDAVLLDDGVKNNIITSKYKVNPSNLIEGAVHTGWTSARYKAFLVSWNTDKVKPADVPKSYADLADPKWKGQLAMEVGDFSWFRGLYDYYTKDGGMSPDQFTSLWQKIAANARVVKGHTSTAELLASGEYSIFVDSYDDGIIALQQKGAPVAYQDSSKNVPVQPVFINQTGIGITAQAPQPAGAMLFTDFFLSKEGQQLVNDAGNIPAYKGINHELDGAKTFEAPLEDVASKAAQDAYSEILQHAAQG